jgi:hypothetical protein
MNFCESAKLEYMLFFAGTFLTKQLRFPRTSPPTTHKMLLPLLNSMHANCTLRAFKEYGNLPPLLQWQQRKEFRAFPYPQYDERQLTVKPLPRPVFPSNFQYSKNIIVLCHYLVKKNIE